MYVPPRQLDAETILPIELVREHCRLDDVARVGDGTLALYRDAAFEAAEQYTGRNWRGTGPVTIPVAVPRRDRLRGGRVRMRLPSPTVDGIIVVNAGADFGGTFTVTCAPGATVVDVPITRVALDASCNPSCAYVENYAVSITYNAGVLKGDDIPAGIKLGCLKYIAWSVENPGDDLVTVSDGGLSSSKNGISGTNNGTWASGAVELWRQYRTGLSQ